MGVASDWREGGMHSVRRVEKRDRSVEGRRAVWEHCRADMQSCLKEVAVVVAVVGDGRRRTAPASRRQRMV